MDALSTLPVVENFDELLPCPTVKAVIYYTVEDDTNGSGLPYYSGVFDTGYMDKEVFAIRFPLFTGEDGDSLWWEINPEFKDSATIVFFYDEEEGPDFRTYVEDMD